MLKLILLTCVLVAISVIIQAYCSVFWVKKIKADFKHDATSPKRMFVLLVISFLFFALINTLQTIVWAVAFYTIPETATSFSNFIEAIYFSMVTFTSLGYGDITLSGYWRLLSGLEAINGIMLIGWSTAMMYSLIQNIYKKIH